MKQRMMATLLWSALAVGAVVGLLPSTGYA